MHRWSQLFIPTLREAPADADVASHKFLLRAGYIRQLAAGLYDYLYLGQRSMLKIQQIVREEMDKIGQEFYLPALHPRELWEASGRWSLIGENMFRLKDRKGADLCLGFTHEEVMTDIARKELRSYKQLPQIWYQIQTKFRDEPRPKSGLLRVRQFIMKDSYSFDLDAAGLDVSYQRHHQTYCKIFDRCGLKFMVVEAHSGAMGGSQSHEFMVSTEAGEDMLNEAKLSVALEGVATRPMHAEEIEQVFHSPAGYLGPVGIPAFQQEVVAQHQTQRILLDALPVVLADTALKGRQNLISGANKEDFHLRNVTPERDFTVTKWVDVRNVDPGDPCVNCGSPLRVSKAVEIGHIFKLGYKYAESMGARVLDKDGKEVTPIMGSYGIGIERILTAAIEQSHDEVGFCLPPQIAPFEVVVTPTNMQDSVIGPVAQEIAEKLEQAGIDVLLDDRDERPGVKFKDADLVGIPYRVTVGKKVADGKVEVFHRSTGESQGARMGASTECMSRT